MTWRILVKYSLSFSSVLVSSSSNPNPSELHQTQPSKWQVEHTVPDIPQAWICCLSCTVHLCACEMLEGGWIIPAVPCCDCVTPWDLTCCLCDQNSWRHSASAFLNNTHTVHADTNEFSLMPSGRHYNVLLRRANHYSKSFIPSAIKLQSTDLTHFKGLLF